MTFIISTTCKRIVHYLVEAATYKLFAYEICHLVLLVFCTLYNQTTFQLCRYLHIIISIYTENILYNITWALYIYSICRYIKLHTLVCF